MSLRGHEVAVAVSKGRFNDEIASLTLAMTFRRKCHCEGLNAPKQSLSKASGLEIASSLALLAMTPPPPSFRTK